MTSSKDSLTRTWWIIYHSFSGTMGPMSPEERKILEETYRLTKENRKDLKKIRRHMTLGTIFRTIYWVLIIGVGIGFFYFLQPYLDNLIGTYSGLTDRIDTVNSFFSGSATTTQ